MAKSALASLNFNHLYCTQKKIDHVDTQYQLKHLSLGNKSLKSVHWENLPALETFLATISSQNTRLQDPCTPGLITLSCHGFIYTLSRTPSSWPLHSQLFTAQHMEAML